MDTLESRQKAVANMRAAGKEPAAWVVTRIKQGGPYGWSTGGLSTQDEKQARAAHEAPLAGNEYSSELRRWDEATCRLERVDFRKRPRRTRLSH